MSNYITEFSCQKVQKCEEYVLEVRLAVDDANNVSELPILNLCRNAIDCDNFTLPESQSNDNEYFGEFPLDSYVHATVIAKFTDGEQLRNAKCDCGASA